MRKNRDNFRGLLNEKYQEGIITIKTKWKELIKIIKDDIRYTEMISQDQSGSLPSELFGDFMEELEERYHIDKKKLKEILTEMNFNWTPKTTFQSFVSIMSQNQRWELINEKHHEHLFAEFLEKNSREEKKKEKEAERKKKKIMKEFLELLDKKFTSNLPWEEIKPQLMEHSAYQSIPTDEEREKIFQEFVLRKKSEDSDYEEGRIRSESPEDRKRKHKHHHKKEKKHKHKRHHEASESDGEKDRKKKSKIEKGGSKESMDRSSSSSEEEGETREK